MANKKSKAENQKLTLLSLFSGAGGMDLAFETTGHFITKLCIESETLFSQTLHTNQKQGYLPTAVILLSDIESLNPKEVWNRYWLGSVPDGIIGGPPCESYSSHGRRLGIKDPRGKLVFVFMEWVIALRPKFFLMENVPLLAESDGGRVLKSLLNTPRRAGYTVDHRILDASYYGAATKRKRLIILGFHGDFFPNWPRPTHGETDLFCLNKSPVSVRKAFEGLPPASTQEPGVPQGHVLVNHTPAVTKRFAGLRQGEYDNVRKRSKLTYDRPAPALVAGNLAGIRSHIHPELPRELTNRESARLHGFPDNFEFCGNHAAIGKQVANSVPLPLAVALASAIATQLESAQARDCSAAIKH